MHRQHRKTEDIDNFIAKVGAAYKEKIGYAADFYVVDIGDGAGVLKIRNKKSWIGSREEATVINESIAKTGKIWEKMPVLFSGLDKNLCDKPDSGSHADFRLRRAGEIPETPDLEETLK